MEINNIHPVDTAAATMRTLPSLSTLSSSWHQQPMPVRSGAALAPTQARVHAIAMPAMDAYRASGVTISSMCAGIATDQVATLCVGTSADHKFSTRLGPTASPPV